MYFDGNKDGKILEGNKRVLCNRRFLVFFNFSNSVRKIFSLSIIFFQNAFDKKTSFTKIHIPRGVLERNAEILGLQPPVKEFMVTAYMSTSRAVILIWFLIDNL